MDLVVQDGTGMVANANSYVALADAAAYHAMRLHHDDWAGLVDDQQTLALLDAFTVIEGIVWKGEPTCSGQSNQFPRKWLRVFNRDLTYIDPQTIPPFLVPFQCELARVRAQADLDATSDGNVERSVRIGGMSVDYDLSRPQLSIPAHVRRMAEQWMAPARAVRAA